MWKLKLLILSSMFVNIWVLICFTFAYQKPLRSEPRCSLKLALQMLLLWKTYMINKMGMFFDRGRVMFVISIFSLQTECQCLPIMVIYCTLKKEKKKGWGRQNWHQKNMTARKSLCAWFYCCFMFLCVALNRVFTKLLFVNSKLKCWYKLSFR